LIEAVVARERDGFLAWMNRHVLASRDHAAFLASLQEVA
jgi:glutaconate CoA-transferase, subunit A